MNNTIAVSRIVELSVWYLELKDEEIGTALYKRMCVPIWAPAPKSEEDGGIFAKNGA